MSAKHLMIEKESSLTVLHKINHESDQESIETNDSNQDNKILWKNSQINGYLLPEIEYFTYFSSLSYPSVQPKRKIFQSAAEKQRYINEYQKKIKTEVCKNWQIKGVCIYGNQCSFAHGQQELVEKTHLKSTYKTKPCKKYFMEGYCSYGHRCQYLHSDIYLYPQFLPYLENVYKFKGLPLGQLWQPPSSQKYQEFLNLIKNGQKIELERLKVFKCMDDIKFATLTDFFFQEKK